MKINKILIGILLIIASLLIGYVLGKHNSKKIVMPSTPITIIKDSIIRSEIIKENEVIKWKIKNVEKRYDKEVFTILSNSDSANLSISQTTSDSIKISSEQLRTTNLIFAEHAKLSNQVLLLENQIRNFEKVDSIWLHTDSIRREQISEYEQVIQKQENKLNKIKKWSIFKNYIIGGLCIICLLL